MFANIEKESVKNDAKKYTCLGISDITLLTPSCSTKSVKPVFHQAEFCARSGDFQWGAKYDNILISKNIGLLCTIPQKIITMLRLLKYLRLLRNIYGY